MPGARSSKRSACIEGRNAHDLARLAEASRILSDRDPTCRVRVERGRCGEACFVVSDEGEKFIAHEYRDKGARTYRLENGDELSPIDDDTFKNIGTEQILRRER